MHPSGIWPCFCVGRLGRLQCETKRRAAPSFGVHPDGATMALHDLLADSETDPSPWIFVACVESLKQNEDALGVLGLDANAVVAHGELPQRAVSLGRDVDTRHLWTVVLESI